jgi:hypothetical protein
MILIRFEPPSFNPRDLFQTNEKQNINHNYNLIIKLDNQLILKYIHDRPHQHAFPNT